MSWFIEKPFEYSTFVDQYGESHAHEVFGMKTLLD